MRTARASAVFGITAAPGLTIETSELGRLLLQERKGKPTLRTRTSAHGESLAVGGLILGRSGDVLLHGECGFDPSEVDDIRGALVGASSGEFALVAERSGSILAARDPLGAKPLYQGAADGLSAISTVPSLLRHLHIDPQPVRPGHLVRLKGGALESGRYAPAVEGKRYGGNLGQAAARLGLLLEDSLRLRLGGTGPVAVAFSGGLDSSLLALACSKRRRVLLVSVRSAGSRDAGRVAPAADELGLELHEVEVDRNDLERAVSSVHFWGNSSLMDRSLAAGFFLASSEARAQGSDVLVAGQGADEIFGGYGRHLETASVDPSRLVPQLLEELPRLEGGLRRDELAIARGGCEASFPYADLPIARLALSLPPGFLVLRGERKVVLRELAKRMGVPPSIASAPKKAFQYSSGIQHLLA